MSARGGEKRDLATCLVAAATLGTTACADRASPQSGPALITAAQTDGATTTLPHPTHVATEVLVAPAEGFARAALDESGTRVPRVRTQMSRTDMLVALARGHKLAFGVPPLDPRLAGAFGLCAFENAHGEALYNFNFGNVVAGKVGGLHTRGPEPSSAAMAAHETADAGAAALWRVLKTQHGGALRAFDAANYPKAVEELARFGYFQAPASRYAVAVPQLAEAALLSTIPALRFSAKQRHQSFTDASPVAVYVASEPPLFDRPLP